MTDTKDIVIGHAKVPFSNRMRAWILPGNRFTRSEEEARTVAENIARILRGTPTFEELMAKMRK
jgi:hypothetical protein